MESHDDEAEIQTTPKKAIFFGAHKILFIFIIILLSCMSGTYFALQTINRDRQSHTSPNIEIFVTSVPTPTTKTDLTNTEYEAIKEELFTIVDRYDPRVALQVLAQKIEADNAIHRSCHPLVHEIGRKAYEKYKDFATAIKFNDELCNTGYLHGVIEAHFVNSQDVFSDMKTICDIYQTLNDKTRCYHGVGHGLMYYTANDLPKSLALCRSYNNAIATDNCVQGVYMENSSADNYLHPSKYVSPQDPFYPCEEDISKPYKAVCYYYAPRFYVGVYKDKYEEALRWCKTGNSLYQSSCANGLGAIAIKLNMKKPNEIEKICMNGAPEQTNPCIDGMVGYYVYFYNSIKKGEELCKILMLSNQPTCKAALNGRPELLKN